VPQQSTKGFAVKAPYTGRPHRILVADDDDGYAEALTTILGMSPSLVVVARARDGAEAVVLAHAFRPDAVVMDVNMPCLDGFEATERIVGELPFVRIVIVSGTPETGYAERAVACGAVGFVAKDAVIETLADTLTAAPARAGHPTLRLALAS
jgi:DNA-binding NarL/FixJ family response regulator